MIIIARRFACILLCTFASGCGNADEIQALQRTITDGVLDTTNVAVGTVTGNGVFCTGTLVGNQVVLTAAHCLDPAHGPFVFATESNNYPATAAIQHPNFDPARKTVFNVGLLLLGQQPAGITPAVVSVYKPTVGLNATLVGFGEGISEPMGVRRSATNTVDQVRPATIRFSGTGGGQGNTCNGDEGGPALATLHGQARVAGVAANSASCGVSTLEMRPDVFTSWLLAESGGDLFGLDTQPPQVTITEPANNAQVGATVTVKATVTDDMPQFRVAFYLDDLLIMVDQQPPYEVTLQLTDGPHDIRVEGVDAANNSTPQAVSVTATVPPRSI